MPDSSHYLAYLLRLWTVRQGDALIWRASLEDPQSGVRLGFASLPEMVAYVEAQLSGIEQGESLEREKRAAMGGESSRSNEQPPDGVGETAEP